MMGNTKKEFKIFTITQYRQEEEYLRSMHREGWRFTKIAFPGIYTFEKCEPENVTYRLDYNQEGIANKAEYVQMFSDCGWEYLQDFVGYSYFRKASEGAEDNEEIFCDDESKFDMMKRVYMGRIIPLIIIFFAIILPQTLGNAIGYIGGSGIVQDIVLTVFLGLGAVYLFYLGIFTLQFHQYERKLHPESKQVKWKYAGIYCVLIATALVFAGAIVFRFSSEYSVSDRENGFAIEADRLNKTVTKEFELKKGDTVKVTHKAESGSWYVRIGKVGEEPVFYVNTYDEFEDFTYEIQEDGTYEISCKGRTAKGSIEFIMVTNT